MAVINRRFTVTFLFLTLVGCSSPQISPHYYYKKVNQENGGITYAPDYGLPALRPSNLNGVIVEVEKLRMQFRVESVALGGTSAGLGNFLVGLTAFGLYKGVTHPSTKAVAIPGALGSAAYAYGSINKFGDRANAFNEGYERLTCSLSAAAPYRIHLGQAETGVSDVGELLQLMKESQVVLAALQRSWAELQPYGAPILKKAAKAGSNNCAAWTDKRWRSAYDSACRAKGSAEEVEGPPVSVQGALESGETLEKSLRQDLMDAGRMMHASNAMADRLWYNATKIENGVNTAIGATISSPRDALEAARNSYRQNANLLQASEAAEAKSQKAQSRKAFPPSARKWGEGDKERRDGALNKLLENIRAAQEKSNVLRNVMTINLVTPLSFAEIDRCRSSADEVFYGIADSVAPAAKKTLDVPESRRSLVDASPEFFNGLGFATMPADIKQAARRVEKCQQSGGTDRQSA
ncbi:MAG TPA: hypothetical protein VGD52_16055 [Pseudoduganella sp.]